MPIKPENRARYPKDWKDIRARILERAGHQCEACGVANHAVGSRDHEGRFIPAEPVRESVMPMPGTFWYCIDGVEAPPTVISRRGRKIDVPVFRQKYRIFKIVLTIAHLDHTPENNAPENLRAWCQKCHLAYDLDHHKMNAAMTRRAKLPTPDMFIGELKDTHHAE